MNESQPSRTGIRRVVVWRSGWLPPSETFVRNQVDALPNWVATPVGTRRAESSISRPTDVVAYGSGMAGKLRRKAFELTGIGPRVEREILRAKPNVIHAHFGNDAIRILRYAKKHEIPLIVTLHGNDVTGAATGATRSVQRYRRRLLELFEYSARLIAVSDHIRTVAISLGAPANKTVVHHIGVPIQSPSTATPMRSGLLFVGRLVAKKGAEDLIRALASSPELGGVVLDIVGDGPLRGDLASLADQLGVEVRFRGTLPPEQVKALMAGSEIVVVPSRTAPNGDTEGLPTVVMEAGICGAPVVGYRHAGIPDVVSHDETGLLVDEGDISALAHAIRELLQDRMKARRLGAAAAERIQADFDVAQQAVSLERIYEDALTQPASTMNERP